MKAIVFSVAVVLLSACASRGTAPEWAGPHPAQANQAALPAESIAPLPPLAEPRADSGEASSGMQHQHMKHGRMDHESMDHGAMNHEGMNHDTMDHAGMGHGDMNHEQMGQPARDQVDADEEGDHDHH